MLRRRRRKANLHQIWPMAKHRSYKRPNVTRLPWGTAALLFIVVFVVGVAISQWRGLAQSESPTISTTASLAFAGIKPAEPNMEAANQQQPPKRSAPAYAMPRSNIIFDKFRIFGFCHTGGGENCVVDGDTFWIDGNKVRVADIDAPPYVAVMTTFVLLTTVDVSMMKVAVRAPPATVTLAGTLAVAVSLLVSSTSAPPDGAALGSVMVPCGCPWL